MWDILGLCLLFISIVTVFFFFSPLFSRTCYALTSFFFTFLCNSREWTHFCVKAIEPNGLSHLLKILFHLILLFLVPLFPLSLLIKLFSFSLSDIRKQSTSSGLPIGLYAKIQYLLLCWWISLRIYTYKNLGFVVNFIPFHWTEA